MAIRNLRYENDEILDTLDRLIEIKKTFKRN